MQPYDVSELQSRIAREFMNELPSHWSSYELHYESFTWKSERMEKYTSECFVDGRSIRFDPSLDAIDMLVELQESMAKLSSGRWSSVEFRPYPDGRFSFNFGYGIPPLVAEALRSAGELQ